MFSSLLQALPGQCELCRRWQAGRLCEQCVPSIGTAVGAHRCDGCGLRLSEVATRCGACLAAPLPFERCHCAVDYGAPWDRLIAAYKYAGQVDLAGALADRLHGSLEPAAAAWPDLVVPVPLATERLAERGYNQAWELARRVARRAGRPASPFVLERHLARVPQAGLGRTERRRNLQGAFQVADASKVAGRRIALVDDVVTTGATVAEAAGALMAAGAAAVQVWALARTP